MMVNIIYKNTFRKDLTCEEVAGRLAFRFPAIGMYFVAGDRRSFLFCM